MMINDDEFSTYAAEVLDEFDAKKRDRITTYLDEGYDIVEVGVNADTDRMTSWTSHTNVGVEIVKTVYVVIERHDQQITIESAPTLNTMTEQTDDGVLVDDNDCVQIGIEEVDIAVCPDCGNSFDKEPWEHINGWGDRSGSVTEYECPTDDCTGRIRVYI